MNKYRADVPATNPAHIIASPRARAYLYGILTAVLPLLIALGYVEEGIAALIANIGAAILSMSGTTLALANTPGVIGTSATPPAE